MTAPDAPPVEPLTLTLEEALQRLYAKGLTFIPPGDGTDSWGIGVAGDSPDEEFDTWHEAVSAVEGVPVVPRDDTAELVGVLQELRIRFHAAGRRPEECYELSLIDAALARYREARS